MLHIPTGLWVLSVPLGLSIIFILAIELVAIRPADREHSQHERSRRVPTDRTRR
jgi:hypothetical protein